MCLECLDTGIRLLPKYIPHTNIRVILGKYNLCYTYRDLREVNG